MICTAFAQGAKAPIVPPAPLLPGEMFVYGCLRGLLPTIKQAQREGRTYFYGDNGYFFPGKTERSYFRITKNALQHTGTGKWPKPKQAALRRWQDLRIQIKPWRQSGAHVLVCPPLRLWGAIWGFDSDRWLADTLATLRLHTDRELRVRAKLSWQDNKSPNTPNYEGRDKSSLNTTLAEDLVDAWAVVTHSSNVAVESVLAGVPVFNTNQCAGSIMGLSDLSKIESPIMPDSREHWAVMLANNQFQLSEMRSGLAWRMLNEADGDTTSPA
jgi:hypothetical protein